MKSISDMLQSIEITVDTILDLVNSLCDALVGDGLEDEDRTEE